MPDDHSRICRILKYPVVDHSADLSTWDVRVADHDHVDDSTIAMVDAIRFVTTAHVIEPVSSVDWPPMEGYELRCRAALVCWTPG